MLWDVDSRIRGLETTVRLMQFLNIIIREDFMEEVTLA